MKYKCDMVKDIMPLCLDKSATETSEQVVIEHLAECKECLNYYNLLNKDISLDGASGESEMKYSVLAKKLRKRKSIRVAIIALFVYICVFLSINYAQGYRMNPQSAADISGRLNYKSKLLGSYEWNTWKFYIYDSYSCYDVVLVKKAWLGWKVNDTCLSWPKFFETEGKNGIEMAGALFHWSYNDGIQLFSYVVNDERIKSVEVTVFGETKIESITQKGFHIVTFETSDIGITNDVVATAYDDMGNVLYTLEEEYGYWIWKSVE
ncbi:zf-HC2 domain-containing protein [Anaerosporobacter sp.]|uniref:zf-HC2 domain-containing protein n=1 Tax=Anaerosporobacter sp. TaxID=1872529 RepID=UPI00286F1821|nr:hypothetical protein [Anaerosporobacter sp.]